MACAVWLAATICRRGSCAIMRPKSARSGALVQPTCSLMSLSPILLSTLASGSLPARISLQAPPRAATMASSSCWDRNAAVATRPASASFLSESSLPKYSGMKAFSTFSTSSVAKPVCVSASRSGTTIQRVRTPSGTPASSAKVGETRAERLKHCEEMRARRTPPKSASLGFPAPSRLMALTGKVCNTCNSMYMGLAVDMIQKLLCVRIGNLRLETK